MIKKVLLLAVSCKNGGLCPGGIDMDNPQRWIRIVKNDGRAGAVQGFEIGFAKPLDIIQFDGTPMPQGKQQENWVINNNSCRVIDHNRTDLLQSACDNYGYHGYWGNYKSFLSEGEFIAVTAPSESILKVRNVRVYTNEYGKTKIDFEWSGSLYPVRFVSMTDPDYYPRIKDGNEVKIENAYIVISIPKEIDDFVDPTTGEKKAFKFVSKIFEI